MENREEIKLGTWTDKLQSKGKNAFSLDFLKQELPAYSAIAIKRALSRLSAKGKIVSVFKGYYLIIPPQYAPKGILPPALFIDGLMQYLNRPYYAGLVSAAAFHGAAHQQPQEFFIFTGFPVLRPINKHGMKINFISIAAVHPQWLMDVKTEAGYLKISNPLFTAADLIRYEKRIGGLNRAATVLNELSEVIQPELINSEIIGAFPAATWQRMGFILDNVLDRPDLAEAIYRELQNRQKILFRTPLKPSGKKSNYDIDEKWNVIVNTNIETDI